MLQAKFIKGKHKYEIIKLNTFKTPSLETFTQQKIYVLVAQEKNLEEELKELTSFAEKLPNCRFLILREHLVD